MVSSLNRSRDILLYTNKETSLVLFYDKIWLLVLPPAYILLTKQTLLTDTRFRYSTINIIY